MNDRLSKALRAADRAWDAVERHARAHGSRDWGRKRLDARYRRAVERVLALRKSTGQQPTMFCLWTNR